MHAIQYTLHAHFTSSTVLLQCYCLFQQRFWRTVMPTLARHNSLFSLTMWPVLDQNPDWWTAPMTVTLQTAHTPRMLVLVVIQVRLK